MEGGELGETGADLVGIIIIQSLTEYRVEVAAAGSRRMAIHVGDVDECADEGEVEQYGDERREHETGDAAQGQQGDEGVQGGGARDALDGAGVGGDVQIVVVHGGEEVGEDAEDDGRAGEFNSSEEPLEELESGTGPCAHDCLFTLFSLSQNS